MLITRTVLSTEEIQYLKVNRKMVDRNKKAKEELKHAKQLMGADEGLKQKEFVEKQKNYKSTFLARLYKGAELKEIRDQLESGKITMQWYGQKYPKHILAIEHDMIQDVYKDLISQEQYLKQALIVDGLTTEQITELEKNGNLLKEIPSENKKV